MGDVAAQRGLRLLVLAALGCTAAAMGCDLASQMLADLSPRRDAWSASVAVLAAYQGLHVALLALAAPYLCARSWSGHITAASRATLNNVALVWYYTAAQGVLAAWLPRMAGA